MNNKNFLIFSGNPIPLGANFKKNGVNFAVVSRKASQVILHLFENSNSEKPFFSYNLSPKKNKTGDVWHIFIEGLRKNIFYLYSINGVFLPKEGILFDKNNFLIDPYSKQLTNHSVFKSEQIQNQLNNQQGKIKQNCTKNKIEAIAKGFPKAIAIENNFDWQGDKPINLPLRNCVIYEAHLKGFTKLNYSIEENKRGTYLGVVKMIPYLKKLGITSIEFLPVFEFDENENFTKNPKTGERLKNYWGYSTICFFAPKASYACEPQNVVNEFKLMVRELHKAGIEIILDVVFNHTAEGNENGFVFSFKGFDTSYYHLEENKAHYKNYSGCGNSLNASNPITTNLILDSLRYWVSEMHIDGFRFDLAPILARNEKGEIDLNSYLIKAIAEDPVLYSTKIIAEPWDAAGAYMSGQFYSRWAEWNGLYRDAIRNFWLQPNPDIRHLATRLTGSSDLYFSNGKRPYQSINFVCCHDGFSLYDLLSYNNKHNEENGEENKDGSNENLSYNFGTEGKADAKIENERIRMAKNILLTLLISVGTPMLNMGDEFLRTKQGNNNSYCQDNAISRIAWELAKENEEIFHFTKKLISLRKNHFSFIRKRFFTGITNENTSHPDLLWFNNEGQTPDWNTPSQFLGFLMDGNKKNLDSTENDNDFYIMLNSYEYDVTAKLPKPPTPSKKWHRLIDTSYLGDNSFLNEEKTSQIKNQEIYIIVKNSAVVLISKD